MINYNNRSSTEYILMLMDQIKRTIAAFYTFDSTLRLHTENPSKTWNKRACKMGISQEHISIKKIRFTKDYLMFYGSNETYSSWHYLIILSNNLLNK